MGKPQKKTSILKDRDIKEAVVLPYSYTPEQLYYTDDNCSLSWDLEVIEGIITTNYSSRNRNIREKFLKEYKVVTMPIRKTALPAAKTIRSPTKKSILRGLGLTKRFQKDEKGNLQKLPSLKREKASIIGEGWGLGWRGELDRPDNKTLSIYYNKIFKVEKESTEAYLYRELNVQQLCRLNKFAKYKQLQGVKNK